MALWAANHTSITQLVNDTQQHVTSLRAKKSTNRERFVWAYPRKAALPKQHPKSVHSASAIRGVCYARAANSDLNKGV